MMLFLIYLLEVSAVMLGLFMIYYFLLRHHTFYQANRICLLLITLFSFIVPFVPASLPARPVATIVFKTKDYHLINPSAAVEQLKNEIPSNAGVIPWLVMTVYLLGAIFFSYRFLKSMMMLCRLSRESTIEANTELRIKRSDLRASFTFLNTIFLPKSQTDIIILQHEQAHVRQFHWIDLLVAEITSIILWFNPVVLLLKHELRLQHEFLADRSVMASGVSFEDYAQCLVKHMSSDGITFNVTSPLFSNSSKKRILMMTKKKTSYYMMVVYLLMVPACAIMLMSFGKKQNALTPDIGHGQSITTRNTPDIAPVDFTKVKKVVLYGDIMNPRTNEMRNHTGIDFQLSAGSDVVATADGVVMAQAYGDKPGNFVRIKHNETYSTRYYHLETALVKVGDKVTKGQVIGLVGNTGLSSVTPHLHYEILKNDATVDPRGYLPELPGL